jgi:hypothetical protein
MGWGHLKNFFSRTTKPEKLRITPKLPEILQTQVCTNHGPWGWVGPQWGKPFLHGFFFSK